MGIRNKLLFIIASALLLVLYVSTHLQINLHKQAFDTELEKRIVLLKHNLNQQALVQAQALSSSIAENLASFNLFSLTQIINDSVNNTPELQQAILVSKNGKVFIHTSDPLQQQLPYQPTNHGSLSQVSIKTPDSISVLGINNPEDSSLPISSLEYRVPITIGESNWGDIYLLYSLKKLNKVITQSIAENTQLQEEQTNKAFYSAGAILLVAFVLISQLAERLVEPIVRLSAYTKEIANGNFTKVHNAAVTGTDEIAELSHNFTDMAKNLEENYLEQAQYNLTLEAKVNERTKALHKKNEELLNAFKKVEESQQQLIYSEKMAALGQLIAGIAHEINTPLGAIGASASNTSMSLEDHLTQLKPILEKSPDPDAQALNKIISLLGRSTNNHSDSLSTREERAIKRSLSKELAPHHQDGAEDLAELLLEMGLHDQLNALKPEILDPENNKIVSLAHSLTSIRRNNMTIHTAIARVSKIVFALKSFSHQDCSGEMIQSNINDGIKTVLVLYQNQFKQGCEVHLDYGDLPSTLCYPDELNQVWTNLTHNALQAMHNEGELSVSTKVQEGNILVQFTDNGPGIPEDIQEKVFSSFFTTKPAGEGSGLGLGICKKIVDKHQGNIDFESEVGRTTFSVSIPIRVK